jgi:hypothetical protein
MGAQSLRRGVLIRTGCTGAVRTAMVLDVATLGATLFLGTTVLSPTGTVLAAAATITGGLAELAWLRWKAKC